MIIIYILPIYNNEYMKFYNRESELERLKSNIEMSKDTSIMSVIIGRRRIGKTKLILKSVENEDFLYFFIAKKNESLLCEEFTEEAKDKGFNIFGTITKFKELFELLLVESKERNFTLIIDEFQEFNTVNSAVFSEMQNIWDKYKDLSRLNLILCGSIYSMMKTIFEDSKEPLFGRANEKIYLQAFNIVTLKEILAENNKNYTPLDLLSFYSFTGGVAKYVELFVDRKILTYESMVDEIFRPNSYFLEEGKNMLIEEFGKEYSTYFSILSLIASSKTSRTEIESLLAKNIGGFLDKLENQYNLIRKVRPILAKPGSRKQKYYIKDNFLNFWFRFIYKNRSAIEIGNFDYLKAVFERDFSTFSGRVLEQYFMQKLSLLNKYSEIGTYWEKANQNEIDIVAIDELNKEVLIAEVKLNKKKISINTLINKSKKLIMSFKGYKIEYKGFSIEDL